MGFQGLATVFFHPIKKLKNFGLNPAFAV